MHLNFWVLDIYMCRYINDLEKQFSLLVAIEFDSTNICDANEIEARRSS